MASYSLSAVPADPPPSISSPIVSSVEYSNLAIVNLLCANLILGLCLLTAFCWDAKIDRERLPVASTDDKDLWDFHRLKQLIRRRHGKPQNNVSDLG